MAASRSWRDVVQIHPCADVFPQAKEDDIKELAKSIRETGLREGVTLWEVGSRQFLLDGQTRLDALERLGIKVIDGDGLDEEFVKETINSVSSFTAAQAVIAGNIRRRHLTPKQRATLAAEAIAAERAMRKDKPPKGIIGKSFPIIGEHGKAPRKKGVRGSVKGDVAQVAEMAGVSKPTARKAIREARGKKGSTKAKPKRVVASFAEYIERLRLSQISDEERLLLVAIRDRIDRMLQESER